MLFSRLDKISNLPKQILNDNSDSDIEIIEVPKPQKLKSKYTNFHNDLPKVRFAKNKKIPIEDEYIDGDLRIIHKFPKEVSISLDELSSYLDEYYTLIDVNNEFFKKSNCKIQAYALLLKKLQIAQGLEYLYHNLDKLKKVWILLDRNSENIIFLIKQKNKSNPEFFTKFLSLTSLKFYILNNGSQTPENKLDFQTWDKNLMIFEFNPKHFATSVKMLIKFLSQEKESLGDLLNYLEQGYDEKND